MLNFLFLLAISPLILYLVLVALLVIIAKIFRS